MAGITTAEIMQFFLDPFYLRILYLTLILFVVAWVIWGMYISLAKRDLFKLTHPKNIKETPTFWDRAFYMIKYLLIFPVFTFMWFVLFVACLRLLSAKQNIEDIMLLGIVIISAVRVASYFSGKMAEDVAKLLPLTLLAGIILNPSFITLNAQFEDLSIFAEKLPVFGKYLLFIIGLEFALRIAHAIYAHITHKNNSPKDGKVYK